MYEYLKTKSAGDSPSETHLSTAQIMYASSVSKLVAIFAAYPHEIIRSRLQDAGHAKALQQPTGTKTTNFREYRNVRDAVRTIAREEGIRGLYRGIIASIFKTVPAAVITLSSYEKIKEFLNENYGQASIHR